MHVDDIFLYLRYLFDLLELSSFLSFIGLLHVPSNDVYDESIYLLLQSQSKPSRKKYQPQQQNEAMTRDDIHDQIDPCIFDLPHFYICRMRVKALCKA